ncbi:MAG TPA: response regulator, partial [Sunxiuqinia sp.]|nr:response regulator [Sunxiuqinia sp.]
EVASEKNIQFSVQSSTDQVQARIDEEKMDSVIFNLLSNAFKFTPENGTITVFVRELSGERKVQIEVKDSGIGVPKNQEESLFTIFSSHHHSGLEDYTGTGIGLALSRDLVELHGGRLRYHPAKRGGATFTIELESIPQQETAALKKQNRNGHKMTALSGKNRKNKPIVLVVEDNSELRTFLRMQLADEYIVEEAVNGEEGMDKAVQQQPDLILSDVMMPVMDGIQLLEQIKNNFDTSHIPVVLLTAKSSVESKIEGLRYGADAYMTKPFNNEQLKAQLQNLMHQRILLRERYAQQISDEEIAHDLSITDPDAEFLNQVRDIIEANLTKPDFKISVIHQQVGMGRSKFFDKLKGLTGLSPIDFVKEYRLNKAKSMLKTGKFSVGEVSFQSGFTDASYFSKRFKVRFGMSPSQVEKL